MSQERMEASKPKSVFGGLGVGTANAEQAVVKTQALSNKVRVVHGANERYFDNLAGKDVGYVRKALREDFGIPGDAVAQVNGKQVTDEFILEANTLVEFSKEAGTKGGQVI